MNRRPYFISFLSMILILLSILNGILVVALPINGNSPDDPDRLITISEGDVDIGYIKVRVLKVNNYPYNIVIEIYFDENIVTQLTGSTRPTVILIFKMEYHINNLSNPPVYFKKYYDHYPLGIQLSSVVTAGVLDHIYISNITLEYAFIGIETIGGKINIYKYMIQRNLETDFIMDLEHYALNFPKVVNDPGWITYKIYSGSRYIGRLEVVASHTFENTSDLRIYLEIYDLDYIDLLDITVTIHGMLSDLNTEFTEEFILYPGEDIVLPKELGIDNPKAILDLITIRFGIRDYSIILNVTNDIGIVTISPQREFVAFPLDAEFLSYKAIGNGWVEVVVGIRGDIDQSGLRVNYSPISGEKPITMRCFIVSDFNYSCLLYIYLVFPQPGSHKGYLAVSDGARRANVVVNLVSDGYPEDVIVKPIEDEFTVLNLDQYLYLEISKLDRVVRQGLVPEEKKVKYLERIVYLKGKVGRPRNKNIRVLYIPVNNSLKFSDYYELNLFFELETADYNSPIVITVNPVYEDFTWEPKVGSSELLVALINGSTSGKTIIGPWIKHMEDELYFTLYNPYSSDLYGEVPNIVGFELYFYNVAEVNVTNIEVTYVSLPPPSESPYVAGLLIKMREKEPSLIDILMSNLLTLITVVATILAVIIGIIKLRKKM